MSRLIRADPERLHVLVGGLDTPVHEGSASESILSVQRALEALLLLESEKLTGSFDADTRRALRRYQRIHQLRRSEIFDHATQQAMLNWWCGNIWDKHEKQPVVAQWFEWLLVKKCVQKGDPIEIRYVFIGQPEHGPADSAIAAAMEGALRTWNGGFRGRRRLDYRVVERHAQANLRVVFVVDPTSEEAEALGNGIAKGSYPPNCDMSTRREEILLRGFRDTVWTVDGSRGTWDLESIVLHELGHLWGFPGCCPNNVEPVMRELVFKNDPKKPFPKRRLHDKDRAILRNHYR